MEWDESTKALIEDVATKAAEKTVTQTMIGFGVDTSNPLEVQRDMQHLRGSRQTWESAKSRSFFAAVGVAAVGAITLFWNGFLHFMRTGGTGGAN